MSTDPPHAIAVTPISGNIMNKNAQQRGQAPLQHTDGVIADAVPRRFLRVPLTALVSLALTGHAVAQAQRDPTWLSLEELMSIEVSSAAKRPQRLADTSTAIYAIGPEEIRRSGATSLPELLRTVPGVQVSRIDGSRYAVSIRGFSSRYSGKLLVLQDGRTLYSPLFSGTYWEAQDVLLEDVERIEVIRGSGGALWGANAVNGVINIITKQARDTQGTYVEAKAGSLENGAALRHGGAFGDLGNYRVYAKVDRHDPLETATGRRANDDWDQKRAGFRADLSPSAIDKVTVQGDAYDGRAGQSALQVSEQTFESRYVPDTARLSGANLLVRWQHETSADENWHLQAYADRARLNDTVTRQKVDTLDVEWQQRLRLKPSHELTWGLGARRVHDQTMGGFTIVMDPEQRSTTLLSGFVQDEIKLKPDLQLTLGSKLEHNAYTGVEVQPNVRLQWSATPNDHIWAAVSRAVQTPSRASTAANGHVGSQPGPFGPMLLSLRGNPDLASEEVISRELGYRGQFGPHLNLDATVFYNTYDNLVSREYGAPQMGRYLELPIGFENLMEGKTYGFELSGNWEVTSAWRLHGSYSRLEMTLRNKPGSSGFATFGGAGNSPRHMVQLHSLHNLGNNLELDANLYYTSGLSALAIEKYTRFDLRLGWRPSPDLEINLIGRNLLDKRHQEYTADDVLATQIPRSVLLQARWTY